MEITKCGVVPTGVIGDEQPGIIRFSQACISSTTDKRNIKKIDLNFYQSRFFFDTVLRKNKV